MLPHRYPGPDQDGALALARYLDALAEEDDALSETIKSIRADQRAGHLTAAEAFDNVTSAELVHRGHCAALTDSYAEQSGR